VIRKSIGDDGLSIGNNKHRSIGNDDDQSIGNN